VSDFSPPGFALVELLRQESLAADHDRDVLDHSAASGFDVIVLFLPESHALDHHST